MTASAAGGRRRDPPRAAAVWIALAGLLMLGVSSLVWIAYRAVGEWQRSTFQLVDQRSAEALTLLTVALNRDMKGAHQSVLAPFDEGALDFDRRYELDDLFARAFARFPYPESFFVWREGGKAPSTLLFNRIDRQPAWAVNAADPHRAYPVIALPDPPAIASMITQVRAIGDGGQRTAAFETTLGGMRYHVVVHVLRNAHRDGVGAVGFTVNIDWIAHHYFGEILDQISRIGRVDDSMSLAVIDDGHHVVASTGPQVDAEGIRHERQFPLSFLDAELVGGSMEQVTVPEWTLSVSASNANVLTAASRGSTRMLWLIILAAGVAAMGILLAVRALRASAELAVMQSEFVASATHELKTPVALFQLIADTLSTGRYHSAETIRSYGVMLAEQTHRLERLIDNVLAYASLGHVARRDRLKPVAVADLIETALERFDARLAATAIEVTVDVSPDLPPVNGDWQALLQALDNVIDNALKYAPGGERLTIRATEDGGRVRIQISDQGPGIPLNERDKVFEKFYRGEATRVGGSGLGLAIARRVIEEHGGSIGILDAQPRGTTVEIRLPAYLRAGGAHAA